MNPDPDESDLRLPPTAAAAVAALPAADRSRLYAQVERARQASLSDLDAAVEGVLGLVPRLLRGRARKLLVGH